LSTTVVTLIKNVLSFIIIIFFFLTKADYYFLKFVT